MTLRECKDGADIAEAAFHGDLFTATSRNGATMKLARVLVEAGAQDGPVEVRFADGRLRFTAASLHRLATLTVEDGDHGIGVRKWRAFAGGGTLDGAEGDRRAEHASETKPAVAA